MSAVILAALLNQIAIPELARWLHEMSASGRVVTDEEALAKLNMDVDEGNAAGVAFLASHPQP